MDKLTLTGKAVVDRYEKYKSSTRGRSSMATSNWPTALAHSCEAYAVFNRLIPPSARRKIGDRLAMIFSEGNDQARIVRRDLEEAGFEVRGQENQMAWGKYQISGRQDFVLRDPATMQSVHTEVKSCAPYTYDSINKVGDLTSTDKDWLAKWYKQVALYMVLTEVEVYWLLLKNKSTGAIKIIEFKMDDAIWETAEAILKKAEKVNHLVQLGEMPPKEMKLSDADVCVECEFFDSCLPELLLGPGAVIMTEEESAELEMKLNRRSEVEPAYREYKEIDEEVKDIVKAIASEGQDKVVINTWGAGIKSIHKKSYTVKEHDERRITFFKLDPKKPGE